MEEEYAREAGNGPNVGNKQTETTNSYDDTQQQPLLRIGCALLPKKVSRYLTPAMLQIALANGLELTLIDHQKSLKDQGHFDAIIHKLRPNEVWEKNLVEYCELYPNTAIIDSVDGIRTLQNRSTMLTPVHGEGVVIQGDGTHTVRVQAPQQVEIQEGTSLQDAQDMLRCAGLEPPLLVKPLYSDGREGSHGLAVLHELDKLETLLKGEVSSDLQPPLVVQQFVEHGGVLFKVYVLGDRTVVSTRPSLGDKYLSEEAREQGLLQLPRISCKSHVYGGQQHHTHQQPQHRKQRPLHQEPPTNQHHHQSQHRHQTAAVNGCSSPSGSTTDTSNGTPSPSPINAPYVSSQTSTRQPCNSQDTHESQQPPAGQHSEATNCQGPPSQACCSSQQQQTTWSPQKTVTISEACGQCTSSAAAAAAAWAASRTQSLSRVSHPPEWVTTALAGVLRERLKLQLFNFDLICPEMSNHGGAHEAQLYYVIDINYFPGVDKIPNFEQVFINFLKQACTAGKQS